MAGGKREAGRELANFVAAYGFPAGLVLDYTAFVRLSLNITRIRLRRSLDVARGQRIVWSGDADPEHADAEALDPAESGELLFQARRSILQAKHRR